MQTNIQKISSFILSIMLICLIPSTTASADFEIPGTCQVWADDGAADTVKILDYDYVNNTYLSLRDVAMVLRDTDKSFSLSITQNSVALTPGGGYVPVGGENVPWENDKNKAAVLKRNAFTVNDQKVVYYTMITRLPSGAYDCFMLTVDLAMLLDVNMTVSDSGSLQIHTDEPFCVSPEELEEANYFWGVNSVYIGDATTGELYYQYQSDTAYPIASTSKLMTCLLTMEAVSEGRLDLEDTVTVSKEAALLAASDDGVIPLEEGMRITVQDLLLGLLLPSSNECAFCLAETIAGSEEAFVGMMNQKATEIGLSRAVFFNSNGLPVYTRDAVPSKQQNRMSTEDMFRLASYLLKVYPQVKEITSLKEAELPSLNIKVNNSNPLLHNLSQATGLKTGTTNRAGACLVTSLAVDDGTQEHDLVVVVFGTEDSIERGRVSGVLARYALHAFYEGREEPEDEKAAQTVKNLPTHAEAAVERVIRTAKNH
ncbi:MAG: serine hydrolase [Bacteroidales bacterium]|nr:serine hydrolase [Lachnoclostridium sp.]MCM1383343.1 serine hydrolase [Lachnoclostridium sp.]MCM1465008.1 serine hydrolase [Bacteroidales bacterium]